MTSQLLIGVGGLGHVSYVSSDRFLSQLSEKDHRDKTHYSAFRTFRQSTYSQRTKITEGYERDGQDFM